jgi:hypothetical protein
MITYILENFIGTSWFRRSRHQNKTQVNDEVFKKLAYF